MRQTRRNCRSIILVYVVHLGLPYNVQWMWHQHTLQQKILQQQSTIWLMVCLCSFSVRCLINLALLYINHFRSLPSDSQRVMTKNVGLLLDFKLCWQYKYPMTLVSMSRTFSLHNLLKICFITRSSWCAPHRIWSTMRERHLFDEWMYMASKQPVMVHAWPAAILISKCRQFGARISKRNSTCTLPTRFSVGDVRPVARVSTCTWPRSMHDPTRSEQTAL